MDTTTASAKQSKFADCRQYTQNLNNDPERARREAEEHSGEYVARSFDGLIAFAYARQYDELEVRLKELGIDPSTVVMGRVLPMDTSLVL